MSYFNQNGNNAYNITPNPAYTAPNYSYPLPTAGVAPAAVNPAESKPVYVVQPQPVAPEPIMNNVPPMVPSVNPVQPAPIQPTIPMQNQPGAMYVPMPPTQPNLQPMNIQNLQEIPPAPEFDNGGTYSLQTIKTGHQIRMLYGTAANVQMFQYAGFSEEDKKIYNTSAAIVIFTVFSLFFSFSVLMFALTSSFLDLSTLHVCLSVAVPVMIILSFFSALHFITVLTLADLGYLIYYFMFVNHTFDTSMPGIMCIVVAVFQLLAFIFMIRVRMFPNAITRTKELQKLYTHADTLSNSSTYGYAS